jgi:ribosomal protein S12 methylthiotransferase accessory factor
VLETLYQDAGALRGVLDWVDDRFGPLRRLWGTRLSNPEPQWWLFTCDLARSPVGTWYCPYPAGAAGTSIDRSEALRRTLGEAVERYSGLNAASSVDVFPLSLSESPLIDRFPLCAPDEPCLPTFRVRQPHATLRHTKVRRLATGEGVAIPAPFVCLDYQPEPGESAITMPISTGLAFHAELHLAIWNALCEVAERDAIMLMWWTRRTSRRLECNDPSLPLDLASRLERLRRTGLTTHLFDITTDFRVPTVFCILEDKSYPHYVAGASCKSDPAGACSKALDEAVSVRVSARKMGSASLPSLTDFSWVQSLEMHELLYAHWRGSPALDFLLNQQIAPLPFEEFANHPWWQAPSDMRDLALRAAGLEELGLTVLWTDVTAPEATEFGQVERVVVPEMLPLAQDHNARWLATPRLLRAAGLREGTTSAFNPYPHPFA